MSDRELLELAAKAAGIEGRFFYSTITQGIYQARGEYYWNPLESDSEALRLAVKLGLVIDSGDEVAHVYKNDQGVCETYGDDRMAATRRCIVRAAAALAQGDHHGR